jgi:hypothetical protein
MKASTFILTLVLLLVSCSSPESKAKKAIKESLRLTLNDFKSYEPVQFGKLEVASSKYTDVPELNLYKIKADSYIKSTKEEIDKAEIYNSDYTRYKSVSYAKVAEKFLDTAKIYIHKQDSIRLHFVSEPIGWQITHTFRAKNQLGGLAIHTYLFTLNQELTKVIKSEDLTAN